VDEFENKTGVAGWIMLCPYTLIIPRIDVLIHCRCLRVGDINNTKPGTSNFEHTVALLTASHCLTQRLPSCINISS
jgi:hypothetical protein